MIRREKVKDIVEVRSFTHLYDFAADPGLTIASYHFTDVTSDLMGKWIDRIAEVKNKRGAALALAGLRGVGKSHFIAVLAALAHRIELRSQISDSHVRTRLERLSKKPFSVAFVSRGSESSLISELRTSLAHCLSIDIKELSNSLFDLLLKASEISKDTPLLIFVDTAFGREARVDRDDGAILSEIAEAAINMGIFVGIALDDDISGADGANSSLTRWYKIDFLDQEHLYRIVDRYIFIKNDTKLSTLKDIYSDYRKAMPGFKWSEQRFTSLYPLHPATLEISPLIRLFIQDFALLGFASEAGVKIMGRPADSLIGLDEMFNDVEPRLRKDPQLKGAFEHFDALERSVVQKSPVQFRLQAKLILKGLLLLSLNGQGASAADIAASMMVFDEQDPQGGVLKVEELLEDFSEHLPDAVSRFEDHGSKSRFCIAIGLNDDLDQAISVIRPDVSKDDVWLTLLNQLAERFPEIPNEESKSEWSSTCTVEWRGGMRRGQILWNTGMEISSDDPGKSLDWQVVLQRAGDEQDPQYDSLIWETPPLTPDETEIIAKYYILKSRPELRQKFLEGTSTTIHILAAAVDKICQRIFVDDASIYSDEVRIPFGCDLHSTHNLAQLFTDVLRPIFERRYPSHPYFLQPLGYKEVAQLTAAFFGGADVSNPRIQNLAQLLAEPLGLTEFSVEEYVPAHADALVNLPSVKKAFGDWSGDETLSLASLSARLSSPPEGLTREAQQLILAALVSQREIEFVTTTGNRISHRSLDLQIIWDDVVGASRPAEEKYSKTRLITWIQILTGNYDIKSLSSEEDKARIGESLHQWLREWTEGKILEDYESLPDESLSATSWRNAAAVRKSLGSVANVIRSYTDGSVPLEECIGSIADLFLDSDSEFERMKNDLEALREFTEQANRFRSIHKYLSEAEISENEEVENARLRLLPLIENSMLEVMGNAEELTTAWTDFMILYKEYYQQMHDELFVSTDRQSVSRELSGSAEWQHFEFYSLLSVFDRRIKTRVEYLFHRYRSISCRSKAIESLDTIPTCLCGLQAREIRNILATPDEIRTAIASGVAEATTQVTATPTSERVLSNEDTILLLSASLAGTE